MLIALFRALFGGFVVAILLAASGNAATFVPANTTYGTSAGGIKIEGDIVPGDAQRLLDAYKKYGTLISPLYLRSRGGDVAEAMAMGTIIRRLRLATDVPVWESGKPPVDRVHVDDPQDEVCASACFLIYAGGAERSGNYLALHRPYLPRDEAKSISDDEYVSLQKQIAVKVKAYLADMEVDNYWIGRMFSESSQEYYMPSYVETGDKAHRLEGIVPSLEEVVLTQCTQDPNLSQKLQEAMALAKSSSPADKAKLDAVAQEMSSFDQCEDSAMDKMRAAAFERENEAVIAATCKDSPALTGAEQSTFMALRRKGLGATPDELNQEGILIKKDSAHKQCPGDALLFLTVAYRRNWHEASKAMERAAQPQAAVDFNAPGLSAEAMAQKGKDAYRIENYDAAARWFRKAADLGNADAMLGMSWIYGNGSGVPKDDAEATRWRKMSADHGNTDAMDLIAYNYEQGSSVTQDYGQAMIWYKKAADRNDASAMCSIGMLYEHGQGVVQNYTEAMGWYRNAADHGDSLAMWMIAMMYEYGHGLPVDEAQARVWIKKAAALGFEGAQMWLTEHP